MPTTGLSVEEGSGVMLMSSSSPWPASPPAAAAAAPFFFMILSTSRKMSMVLQPTRMATTPITMPTIPPRVRGTCLVAAAAAVAVAVAGPAFALPVADEGEGAGEGAVTPPAMLKVEDSVVLPSWLSSRA